MRGKVLAFDTKSGNGTISGDDGNRYALTGASLGAGVKGLIPGQEVDFMVANDNKAADIFPIKAHSASAPGGKSKVVAGLLALFLGGLGVHKFYLGRIGAGVFRILLLTLGYGMTLIAPFLVMGMGEGALVFSFLGLALILVLFVIQIVEAILYFTKSDEAFYEKYVVKK